MFSWIWPKQRIRATALAENIDKFNIMYKYSIYSYLQLLVIHIRIVRIYSVFGEEAAALTLQDLY